MRCRIASRNVLSAMALILVSTLSAPFRRRGAGGPRFADEQVLERLPRRRHRDELRTVAVQDRQETMQVALRGHPDQDAVVAPRHDAPARLAAVGVPALCHLSV